MVNLPYRNCDQIIKWIIVVQIYCNLSIFTTNYSLMYMKKIIIFSMLLIGRQYLAQGNLQFNQVLTFTGMSTTNPYTVGTVPVGKVWKIENFASERNSYPANISFVCSNIASNAYLLNIGYPPNQLKSDGPIWLKAGDYIQILNSSAGYPSNFFFSILEFNIVP